MTRAREETKVFIAREDAPDLKAVVRNIDSRRHYGASLNYAAKPTSPEPPPIPRAEEQRDNHPEGVSVGMETADQGQGSKERKAARYHELIKLSGQASSTARGRDGWGRGGGGGRER